LSSETALILRTMSGQPHPITDLLTAWQEGDPGALAELARLVCDDLRRMARRFLAREPVKDLLQTTVLVDEFFITLLGRRSVSFKNREHFFGFAGQTMRRFLVDHARRRLRVKHGAGEVPISLGPEHEQILASLPHEDLVAVHEALERLETKDPRMAQVVTLRYFLGMTVAETAAALNRSEASVKRDWEFARLWLYQELQRREPTPDDHGPDGGS
jgi:RNA polymerase sigma factor (TIGR02999 family)